MSGLRFALGVALVGGAGAARAAWTPAAEAGHPIVRNYPPGEHLRAVANHPVIQDGAGFMYFGAGADLLTYDGSGWASVKATHESAGVRQFVRAADGTVYAAGAGLVGYLRGAGATAEFVSLRERLPEAHRDVDQLRYAAAIRNTVYFSDEEKILVWRGNRFTVVPSPTPPNSRGNRLHRIGNTLYVTAPGRPLARLAQDRLEPVADDPVLRENQIIAVEAGDGPGAFVLLTAERGFFDLRDGRATPRPTPANRWLAGQRVFRAARLPDGSRAIAFSAASGDGGMLLAPDGSYAGPIDTSIGLHAKTVRAFWPDREGGLWIGLETGAARLEWPSPASHFDVVNGLGQGAVTDLVRHEGVLYVATSEGVFRLARSDGASRMARFERVRHGSVRALASLPAGLFALGPAELLRLGPVGFATVASLATSGVTLTASASPGARLWVATTNGVVGFDASGEGWRQSSAAFSVRGVERLAEAADGTVWGTGEGGAVFRLRPPAGVEHFTPRHGLPVGAGTAAVVMVAGEPRFVFRNTARVFRFDEAQSRFTPLADGDGLPADAFAGLTTATLAASDGLWLAGATGAWHLPRGMTPRRLPHYVAAAAGPATRLLAEDGVLWIGGERGLVRMELAGAVPPPVPFAARLTARGVRAGEELRPEHAPLAFSYLALRQRPTSAVVYQTRLVGREADWSPWEPARERQFPHLPSGQYRFEVRARDADGVLSETATLEFAVRVPRWRAWWALLGYAGAGAGLVAAVVGVRTRALRRRAERLEQVVAERTAELEEKNRELTRLHWLESEEKIAARLAEEKSRLEVLRYQLNPHFLFNTLASISAALPAGRTPARSMLERLAEFCRLTLHRSGDRDSTTLGEEIRLLRAYLEIEQSRWGDLMTATIECDPALERERLPHFLLLPLVENALKYGCATSPDQVAVRVVARRDDGGTLEIEIANTGEWVEPAQPRTAASLGIGLENVRERLARYYAGRHTLQIVPASGWVKVVLRIAAGGVDRAETGPRVEPSSVAIK